MNNRQNNFNISSDMPPVTRQLGFTNDYPNTQYISSINIFDEVNLDNEIQFRSSPTLNSLEDNTDKKFSENLDKELSENLDKEFSENLDKEFNEN